MTRVALAFYRASGTRIDRVIRAATRSIYSHVELVDLDTLTETATGRRASAISASWRDGGVRHKVIDFDSDAWEWVPVEPWYPCNVLDRAAAVMGARYDLGGLLMSQIFNLRRHADNRWFCSELCGHALGLSLPQTLSPGDLARRVADMNGAFERGLQASV